MSLIPKREGLPWLIPGASAHRITRCPGSDQTIIPGFDMTGTLSGIFKLSRILSGMKKVTTMTLHRSDGIRNHNREVSTLQLLSGEV